MSPLLFASARTMSFPLCSVFLLISMPCASKKPFLIPRSSGRPFAIGSVSTVIVVSFAVVGALAAAPLNAARIAQASELGELLRRDLVPRSRERNGDDLLHLRRRVGQDDDPVGEVHGFVDVVGDEEDGD